jgi:hypothetical protein
MLEQYSAPITADARPDTRVSFGTGCHEQNPRRFWPSAQPGCTGDTVKLPHALTTPPVRGVGSRADLAERLGPKYRGWPERRRRGWVVARARQSAIRWPRRAHNHVTASARRPASVIVNRTTVTDRPPARIVRGRVPCDAARLCRTAAAGHDPVREVRSAPAVEPAERALPAGGH